MPSSVITPGPGKTAPNAAPTASEQVPANDGRGNPVNTKSQPAASRRLVYASSSIFRPIVRKLCPPKGRARHRPPHRLSPPQKSCPNIRHRSQHRRSIGPRNGSCRHRSPLAVQHYRRAGGPPARWARADKPHHHPFFCGHCGPVFRLPGSVAALFSLLPAEFPPTKHDPKTPSACNPVNATTA